jgi:hypothetical protein
VGVLRGIKQIERLFIQPLDLFYDMLLLLSSRSSNSKEDRLPEGKR